MTSLPQPNPDPGFNINTAFNTMNQRLGELVRSGKMSIDQARAAQAEMRALQLNPAGATRQAATDIFQRHLQVGKYHPENVAAAQRAAERAAQQPQGGLTQAQTAQATARPPYATLMMPTPQNGMAPQIKQQTPTQAQVDAYYAGNPDMNNSYWNPYAGSFETRPQVSQPVTQPPEIVVTGQRMPETVAPPPPPMPQPPTPVMPRPPVVYDTFRPVTPPSAPPQAPLFDRNASLKQLNETFGNLRNTYGEDALRAAGLTPSVFQGFQKTMRELQLNNNSTQDQHTAALQNAYNTMNSFTNNLKPRQLPAPPMALPGGTGYDEQGNMIRSKPDYLSGIGSLLANFGKGMGNAPMQPDFIGKHFTGSAPPPGKKYIETSEGLVPVPINDVPVKPAMGPGLGGSLGMPMQGVGMAPQMPPQAAVAQPASAPQGMAMGGLLRKYYGGGMC